MASNPDEVFLRLDAGRKLAVHRFVCQKALEAWQLFAEESGKITYNDSVVGMYHVVELDLPASAFHEAFGPPNSYSADAVAQRYLEPITAMHDNDLAFPGSIEMAYYAIYNAFRKYALRENIDDWLIVNQALSALPEEEWKFTLDTAIQQAG